MAEASAMKGRAEVKDLLLSSTSRLEVAVWVAASLHGLSKWVMDVGRSRLTAGWDTRSGAVVPLPDVPHNYKGIEGG